jgi:hypothetical protein
MINQEMRMRQMGHVMNLYGSRNRHKSWRRSQCTKITRIRRIHGPLAGPDWPKHCIMVELVTVELVTVELDTVELMALRIPCIER